jgi:glycosyltransferase involved in cell wall biosynthesis
MKKEERKVKISLFTPTHRPIHLGEAYQSLLKQAHEVPWEWVIVPNGDASLDDIPDEIKRDDRVNIIPSERKGIGALKNFACHQCTGDIFVEFDHDDVLTTDAFGELATAYNKEPAGFYYSDFINAKPDGTCETYSPKYGWEAYRAEVDGKEYKACRAFTPTARSICQIFYAPNHVRAWSRKAYMTTRGHDPNLFVGDDHDLICRTYIAGAPFVWIQKPIYIYRRYEGNSFVEYNKEIQIQQNNNCNRYLYQLVRAECRRNRLLMLDIGRADRVETGFESCDIVANNCTESLYYEDGTIGCIRAYDVLQRIPRAQIVPVMNDLYRMLAPGGWILSATPSIDDGEGHPGRGVFQDPSHQSYWSVNNFWYFTDKAYASLVDGLKVRFQQVRCWNAYPSEWHRNNYIPYVYADMCALKGQRTPGETKI